MHTVEHTKLQGRCWRLSHARLGRASGRTWMLVACAILTGLALNVAGDFTTIGGEQFHTVQTLRGASALEGFHTHQKQWLGPLAQHATDAGSALLADGTLRWNRKRRRDTSTSGSTPPVFAHGALRAADDLHRRLTGHRLYPALALR